MKDTDTHTLPTKAPTLRVIPMPANTNAEGDIFGGWVLSQMDLAGASKAYERVGQRIVTVGVDKMNFHRPIFVGDEVSFYTDIQRVGNTSISIYVEVWAKHRLKTEHRLVAEGVYTFVALDMDRQPAKIRS
ncbi:MAG: acyl-CoA thioesterase [Alphaproteobacteria bacterium]|nr:MAG: acyl-CoA thioesterase [Alphaproteobacteria bacterium]